LFLGLPDEHADRQQKFGPVSCWLTPTLLEAARIIGASDVFVGNQSCLAWVALGLCKTLCLEQCNPRNCHFERPNAFYDCLCPLA